jgi:hypothetical protein
MYVEFLGDIGVAIGAGRLSNGGAMDDLRAEAILGLLKGGWIGEVIQRHD